MILTFAVVLTAPAMAQDSFPDISTITPENLFSSTVSPLYGILVVLSGYLSAFIPGIKKWEPFYRVGAFALAIGLGIHLFGGASVWKLAFTYFMSSGLYVIFLRNILPSPKAAKLE